VLAFLGGLSVFLGETAAHAQPAPRLPEGWWVPATLNMPRAAQGRLAWRFTPREIITVSKAGKLERHPADLSPLPSTGPGKTRRWQTMASSASKAQAQATASPAQPVEPLPPLMVEYDETQGAITVTFTGSKAAFFTLNPAGSEDAHRFDSLIVDKYADPAQVRDVCDQAAKCCKVARQPPECVPKNTERTLTRCREVLTKVRQDLAASHQAIHASCR
jgi:hypothetical protein